MPTYNRAICIGLRIIELLHAQANGRVLGGGFKDPMSLGRDIVAMQEAAGQPPDMREVHPQPYTIKCVLNVNLPRGKLTCRKSFRSLLHVRARNLLSLSSVLSLSLSQSLSPPPPSPTNPTAPCSPHRAGWGGGGAWSECWRRLADLLTWGRCPSASERKGNSLNGSRIFYLYAKVRIWP